MVAVLKQFVPDPVEAIQVVNGRACLVDGTITPCWSYADHPELWSRKRGTTGFNVQFVSLLDGEPVCISDPLPGKTHDVTAFTETPVAGGGELSVMDQQCNAEIPHCGRPWNDWWHISRHGGSSTPITAAHAEPIVRHTMPLVHCSSSRSPGV